MWKIMERYTDFIERRKVVSNILEIDFINKILKIVGF